MGQLFKPDIEAPLQQGQVIACRFAGPHEPAVRHQQCGGEVSGKVAAEQAPGGPVSKLCTIGERSNRRALLQHRKLQRDLKIARALVEQFRELELAGMKIEPPQRIGHDIIGQNSKRKLVLLP